MSFKDPEIDFVACSVFFITRLIRPSLQSPPLSPLHLSLQPPQLSRLVPFSNFTFAPTPPKPVARSSCETCFARLRVLCRKEHGLRGRGVTPWPRVRLSAFDSCVPRRVAAGPMWDILGHLALPLSDQYSSELAGVWCLLIDVLHHPRQSAWSFRFNLGYNYPFWPARKLRRIPYPFTFIFLRLLRLFSSAYSSDLSD